jgi:hypothetical protein
MAPTRELEGLVPVERRVELATVLGESSGVTAGSDMDEQTRGHKDIRAEAAFRSTGFDKRGAKTTRTR